MQWVQLFRGILGIIAMLKRISQLSAKQKSACQEPQHEVMVCYIFLPILSLTKRIYTSNYDFVIILVSVHNKCGLKKSSSSRHQHPIYKITLISLTSGFFKLLLLDWIQWFFSTDRLKKKPLQCWDFLAINNLMLN